MFNKSVFDFSWNCITASASVKRRDQRLRCRSSVSLTHTTQKSYRRGRFASDPPSDGRNHYCHFCEPMNQWNRHNADVLWMHMSFILSLKKKNNNMSKEGALVMKWYGALVRGSCTNQCGTRSQCEWGQQYWAWKESVPSSMTLKAGVWWHWGEPRILSLLSLRKFWSRLILNMTDP